MTTFYYFAYGSNMLTSRIGRRCKTASFVTVAKASGYRLEFSKPSIDGSGKATIVQDSAAELPLFGAVFKISIDELDTLDEVESDAYERRDVAVQCLRSGNDITACTYFATVRKEGLVPYDWYLALVVAGLDEHGIDSGYASFVRSRSHAIDTNTDREQRRN